MTVDGGAGDPRRRSGKTSAKLSQNATSGQKELPSRTHTPRQPSHGDIDSNPIT
jgi:hypothetical protein